MPDRVNPVQEKHKSSKSGHTEAPGSALKRPACSRTGRALLQKRMLSITQQPARNSGVQRFSSAPARRFNLAEHLVR